MEFPFGVLIGVLLLAGFLELTDNKTNTVAIWYPESGFIIKTKSEGEKYGKYRYTIKDAYTGSSGYNNIFIRSDENWQMGDTIYLTRVKK